MLVLFVGGPLDGKRLDLKEPLQYQYLVPVWVEKSVSEIWKASYDPTGLFIGEALCKTYTYQLTRLRDEKRPGSSLYWIYHGEDTNLFEQLLAHYRPPSEQDVLEGGQAGRVGQDRRADLFAPGMYYQFGSPLPESCRTPAQPSSPSRKTDKMCGLQPALPVLPSPDEGEEPVPVYVVEETR